MMLNFYRAVKDGKMPARDEARFASFYDGANVMFIIDAILQSHAQQVGDGGVLMVDLAEANAVRSTDFFAVPRGW
jgi:hypothetical protein